MAKLESKPKLVYVKWDDASTRSGWADLDDHDLEPWEVETVGYLIKKNRRHIGVVSSLTVNEEKGSSYTTIPRKMILEMRDLKKARKRSKK